MIHAIHLWNSSAPIVVLTTRQIDTLRPLSVAARQGSRVHAHTKSPFPLIPQSNIPRAVQTNKQRFWVGSGGHKGA